MPIRTSNVLPSLDEAFIPAGAAVERISSIVIGIFLAAVTICGCVAVYSQMTVSIVVNGVAEPAAVLTVRSGESGLIRNVFVTNNQVVARGQLLIQLDSSSMLSTQNDLQSKITESDFLSFNDAQLKPIALETARQQAIVSRVTVGRTRADLLSILVQNQLPRNVDSVLAAPSTSTHIAVDRAKGEVFSAEAQLKLSELTVQKLLADSLAAVSRKYDRTRVMQQLSDVQRRLRAMKVIAPIDGRILTENLQDLIGLSVSPGQSLLEIAQTDQWHVQLLVSETDVRKIHVGQEVSVEISAGAGEWFEPSVGRVSFVAIEPWHPERSTLGPSNFSGQIAAQYRVVVDVKSDDPVSPRRGTSVVARILVKRQSVARTLFDRIVNKGRSVMS